MFGNRSIHSIRGRRDRPAVRTAAIWTLFRTGPAYCRSPRLAAGLNSTESWIMSSKSIAGLNLSPSRTHVNLSVARLVEAAVARGEATLASNGGLVCRTGDRTGRSPKDKYLEDEPGSTAKIGWGGFNAKTTPANFDAALTIATDHLNAAKALSVFEAFVGAAPSYRLGVKVITEQAWPSLSARTLFTPPGTAAAGTGAWKHDWTVINAGKRRLTAEEQTRFGVKSPVMIVQSRARK